MARAALDRRAASPRAILVTGANGFVGSALVPALALRGDAVSAGSRSSRASRIAHSPDPSLTRREAPSIAVRDVRFDLDDHNTVRAALRGMDAAYYLVHGLKRADDYGAWETAAARRFVDAAAAERVQRIVYLGGPDPGPQASAHLRARLATGAVLREEGARAGIDVVELRAAMILGAASDSFRLARDLAMRVPAIFSSPWMETRQRPLGIDDAVVALVAALTSPAGIYGAPGVDIVNGRELMVRMKRACGLHTFVIPLSRGSRRVAGRVAGWLTRVDGRVAMELVDGMGRGDLIEASDDIWDTIPNHVRLSLDECISRALAVDDPGLRAHMAEGAINALARRAWSRFGDRVGERGPA